MFLVFFHYCFFAGVLRDATGNYLASFHMMGSLFILGGVLLLSEPLIRKRMSRNTSYTRTNVQEKNYSMHEEEIEH
jgi:hypothetical protein